MAERRGSRLKWWHTTLGVMVAGLTIAVLTLTLCDQTGAASPFTAASKRDVEVNTERIERLEESHAEIRGWLEAIGKVVGAKYGSAHDSE